MARNGDFPKKTSIVVVIIGVLLLSSQPTSAAFEGVLGIYQLVKACAKSISFTCAKDFMFAIFKKEHLYERCCRELSDDGRGCYEEFEKFIAHRRGFQKIFGTYWRRGEQIYERCIA